MSKFKKGAIVRFYQNDKPLIEGTVVHTDQHGFKVQWNGAPNLALFSWETDNSKNVRHKQTLENTSQADAG